MYAADSEPCRQRPTVNNSFYDELGERWYEDDTHAVALLRAESRLKLRYVLGTLAATDLPENAQVLDIGCGAGFLAIPLAQAGYQVTGLDQSVGSLAAAARRAEPDLPLRWRQGDALRLDFPPSSFDAVLMLDVLEHLESPAAALAEASRVLRPGGLLIFHTFNRTLVARLLAIKALEFFTRDCPKHVHVYDYFIKPAELQRMASAAGIRVHALRGLAPDFCSGSFWLSVLSRRVDPRFRFRLVRSLAVGYVGWGRRDGLTPSAQARLRARD